ncbi:MAG: hypothetical protein RR413_07185 [Christensenellaceae bacterium]
MYNDASGIYKYITADFFSAGAIYFGGLHRINDVILPAEQWFVESF